MKKKPGENVGEPSGKEKKMKVSLFGKEEQEEKDHDEDVEYKDNTVFFLEMAKTLILVVLAGMAAFAFFRAAYSADRNFLPDFLIYIFRPFQFTQVYIVYGISKLLGWEVTINIDRYIIYYPALGQGGSFEIVTACTAVCEMALIAAVILAFRGPRWRKRFLWAGIFAAIVYVENVIRLLMNYPLYKYLGEDGWNTYHFQWMQYGQLVVVLALLFIYVLFIANKEIMRVYKGGKDDEEEDAENLKEPEGEGSKGKKGTGSKRSSSKTNKLTKGAKRNGKD